MNKLLLTGAALMVALPALAQMAPPAPPAKPAKPDMPSQTRAETEARVKDRLGRMDANKDGVVTRDEIMAFTDARMKARADEEFAAMDSNKDGAISRAEFDAFHAKRHGAVVMTGGPAMVHVMRSDGGDVSVQERRVVVREGVSDDTPPPPPGADMPPPPLGAPAMRMHMMMAEGGNTIVIADAVKKALERFDAADTNKDGVLTPEERRAARPMRMEWRSRS